MKNDEKVATGNNLFVKIFKIVLQQRLRKTVLIYTYIIYVYTHNI